MMYDRLLQIICKFIISSPSLSSSLRPSLPPFLSSGVISEALERLQSELRLWPPGLKVQLSQPFRNIATPSEILPSLFEGQLASLVRETL